MIILEGLAANTGTKTAKPFLSGVDLVLPSDRRIALIGTDYEQTTAFMGLLCGLLPPRAGRVVRRAKVSFPVGYLGGFSSTLSIRQNVAYLARLYGANAETIVRFVRRTTELGAAFDKPYGELSKDVKQHLGNILAYALPFDTYLLLKQPKAQSDKNSDAVNELFQARRNIAGMIIPTASKSRAAEYCEIGLVFSEGTLRLYDDLEGAFNHLPNTETAGTTDRREERKLARQRKKRKLARRERAMRSDLAGEGSSPSKRTA